MGNNWFSVLVIPLWWPMFVESSPHHHYVFQILEWFLIGGSVEIPLLVQILPWGVTVLIDTHDIPRPQSPADGFPHWLSHQDVNSKSFWMIIDFRFLLASVLSPPSLVSWNLSQGHVCWLLITSGTLAVILRLKNFFSLAVENICQASFSWELFLTPSEPHVLNCNNPNTAALFLWHHMWLVVVLKMHFWGSWGFKNIPEISETITFHSSGDPEKFLLPFSCQTRDVNSMLKIAGQGNGVRSPIGNNISV